MCMRGIAPMKMENLIVRSQGVEGLYLVRAIHSEG